MDAEPPKKARMGRPPHAPTRQTRARVAVAAGGGVAHGEIARGLGITLPTLLKHYRAELTTGAHARRLEVIETLYQTAMKGSVTAARTYLDLAPQDAHTKKRAAAPVEQPKKGRPMGKKEVQKAEALVATEGTSWATILGTGPVQ